MDEDFPWSKAEGCARNVGSIQTERMHVQDVNVKVPSSDVIILITYLDTEIIF